MKTAVALLLVLILVFALSSVAFAQWNVTWHSVNENARGGLERSPAFAPSPFTFPGQEPAFYYNMNHNANRNVMLWIGEAPEMP